MKNVLLLIHDDAGQEARLQAALDLTRSLSGHLTCLDIVQVPVLAGTEYYPDAELMLLAEARERGAVNAGRVKKRLEVEDVVWSWIDQTGNIAPLIEEAAGLADVVILNTSLAEQLSPDMQSIVSDTVLKSGKPILAVPETGRGLDLAGHPIVAWDGSPPAAEALRAAVPLLAQAGGVTILEIGAIDGDAAEEAAAYLSRHGVHPRIERVDPVDGDVSATLLSLVEQRRPAYCVMGAYGHSRLRERLFGGITRQMLTKARAPLFLGH